MKQHFFGAKSLEEAKFVHPELILCAGYALRKTSIDFSIFDGLRTRAEQTENIRTGVSWTMNSMHLPQEDGLSWAVDLVPYVNGRNRWDSMDAFIEIAKWMREGADLFRIQLTWAANKRYGGDWKTRNDAAHWERRQG